MQPHARAPLGYPAHPGMMPDQLLPLKRRYAQATPVAVTAVRAPHNAITHNAVPASVVSAVPATTVIPLTMNVGVATNGPRLQARIGNESVA